jgi:hypothetical protein
VRHGKLRRLGLAAVSISLVGVGLAAARSAPTVTAGGADIQPLTGKWCGMTDDGGSVRLDVTFDGQYVQNVDIRTFSGAVSFTEGNAQPGAQIKSGQFIIRQTQDVRECTRQQISPGGPSRCVRAPCKGTQPGVICRTVTVETVQIRGQFENVDSLDGTFTFPAGTRRVYGRFTAWPASVAPCS